MAQQKIGRYEVVEKIGQGGMATVYRAFDPNFKRDVAIKVLPREFLHDPTFRERFQREAESIAQLEHSSIVPVYDFGEQQGQPYLVMRYMPGGALDQRLRKGALPTDQVTQIVDRIAAALDSAHQQGIIHRDLKPANILFDQHEDAYLGDFGIVKMLGPGQTELTSSGFIGTPTYMAPEMSETGAHLTPSIDIYALGVTVFEMLAGRRPYLGDTPVKVIMAHINEPVPSVTALRRELPAAVQPVMERALAKSPQQRYQSALTFAEDLRSAFESGDAPMPRTMLERPPGAYGPTIVEPTPAPLPRQPAYPPQAPTGQASYTPPAPYPYQQQPYYPPAPPVPREGRRRRGGGGWQLGIGALLAVLVVAGLLAAAGIYLFFFNPSTALFEGVTIDLGGNPTSPPVVSNPPTATSEPPADGGAPPEPEEPTSEVPPGETPSEAPPPDEPTPVPPPATSVGPGRIAFIRGDSDNAEIAIMDEDGRNIRVLTDNSYYDGEPDYSPDGSFIAFESNEFGNFDIFVMSGSGVGRRRLTTAGIDDRHPAWSPDGSLIAFEQGSGDQSEIMVMNADGSNMTRLTNNDYGDRAPQFSPDGNLITYMTQQRGKWEIAIMRYPSGNLVDLFACSEPDCRFPVWSPDGTQIVYNSLTSGGGAAEIFVIDPANGSVTLVVAGIDNGRPTWSGDGSLIFFNKTQSGNTDIYQYDVGSSQVTRLTIDNVSEYAPDWGPIP